MIHVTRYFHGAKGEHVLSVTTNDPLIDAIAEACGKWNSRTFLGQPEDSLALVDVELRRVDSATLRGTVRFRETGGNRFLQDQNGELVRSNGKIVPVYDQFDFGSLFGAIPDCDHQA